MKAFKAILRSVSGIAILCGVGLPLAAMAQGTTAPAGEDTLGCLYRIGLRFSY